MYHLKVSFVSCYIAGAFSFTVSKCHLTSRRQQMRKAHPVIQIEYLRPFTTEGMVIAPLLADHHITEFTFISVQEP
jgi:hypothetical protein